jgi:hypothetical protein
MCDLGRYRNGTARMTSFIIGITRRYQTLEQSCLQSYPGVLRVYAAYPMGIFRVYPMGIDGYFRVSMGILQNVNYGSPKSRNVRSSGNAGLSGGNFLHSRAGLSTARPTTAFGGPLRRSRRNPEPGSGSVPTEFRSDPERTTDMFGIKSGSRELSPLEVEIKKNISTPAPLPDHGDRLCF